MFRAMERIWLGSGFGDGFKTSPIFWNTFVIVLRLSRGENYIFLPVNSVFGCFKHDC